MADQDEQVVIERAFEAAYDGVNWNGAVVWLRPDPSEPLQAVGTVRVQADQIIREAVQGLATTGHLRGVPALKLGRMRGGQGMAASLPGWTITQPPRPNCLSEQELRAKAVERDFLDFPTAWAIQHAGVTHTDDRCSAVQCVGSMLCDCGAVETRWYELRGGQDG